MLRLSSEGKKMQSHNMQDAMPHKGIEKSGVWGFLFSADFLLFENFLVSKFQLFLLFSAYFWHFTLISWCFSSFLHVASHTSEKCPQTNLQLLSSTQCPVCNLAVWCNPVPLFTSVLCAWIISVVNDNGSLNPYHFFSYIIQYKTKSLKQFMILSGCHNRHKSHNLSA